MAYTATTALVRLGPMDFKIVVDETEAAASSQTAISRRRPNGEAADQAEEASIPRKFRVLGIVSQLRAGTGSTVAPVLSKSLNTTPASDTKVAGTATAAAEVSEHADPIAFVALEGTSSELTHAPVPNDATADHSVRTEYLCRRGWSDNDFDLASGQEVRA